MKLARHTFLGWLARYAASLRFPTLLLVVGLVFLADLIVPDLIPIADEALLGLLTVLFSTWRKKRKGGEEDARTLEVEPVGEPEAVPRGPVRR